MGTRRSPSDGLLIPDPRIIDPAYLAANDASSTGSDYSEATPRPGVAVPAVARSRLAPRVSGAQSEDLDLVVLSGGLPGRDAIRMGYRPSGGADSTVRGWNAPNWLSGWTAPFYSNSTSRTKYDTTVMPGTGQVVLVAYTSSSTDLETEVWDPTDWTWTSGGGISPLTNQTVGTPGVTALPNGRLVLITGGQTYYSDDTGTTWTLGGVWAGPTSYAGQVSLAYLRGDLASVDTDSAGEWYHFASVDLGATWSLVETLTGLTTSTAASASISAISDSLVLAYLRVSDGYACVRVIGSAWGSFTNASVVVLRSTICQSVSVCADENGTVWAFVGASANVYVYYSTDEGLTWTAITDPLYKGAVSNDPLGNFRASWTAGSVLLCHNWTATTSNYDDSIGAILAGGWSTLAQTERSLATRKGGDDVDWIPTELPGDNGWTAGGGGTETLTTPGELQLTSAADSISYTFALNTEKYREARVQLSCGAGTVLTTTAVGLVLAVSDSSDEGTVALRVSTTGFRVYDLQAASAVGSDVTADMTTAMQISLAVDISQSTVACYYRRPGTTAWTAGPSGSITLDSSTAAANGSIEFGNVDVATAGSRWQMVSVGDVRGVADLVGGALAIDGYKGGYPLGPNPAALPEYGAGSGGALARISAHAGPGRLGETWVVPARHDFSVDHLLAGVAPSPAVGWRSTDLTEQIITWDMGANTWLGNGTAVLFHKANFRTAYWEYYDGATWQTLGTLDLSIGLTTLVRNGDTVQLGGTLGLVGENDLAGGSVIFVNGGIARRVRSNSAGVITATTTKQVEVLLDGITGAEATSQATSRACVPSGILYIHQTSIVRARYWRVRIPNQVCADSYFEAGIILPARVQPLGGESSWGGSMTWTPNVTTTRSTYGTTYAVQEGPPAGTWSLAWTDGMAAWEVRTGTDLGYEAHSGGNPLAISEDVERLLRGLLEEVKGGEIPVVAIHKIPSSTSSITDRSLWMYGRLTAAIGTTIESGDYGSTEVTRVESITIEEVV